MGSSVVLRFTCDIKVSPNCEHDYWAEKVNGDLNAGTLWHGDWAYWKGRGYICPPCQKKVVADMNSEKTLK